MHGLLLILAQASDPPIVKPFDYEKFFLGCGILIAVLILGFGGIMHVRRLLKKADQAADDGGFSLSDLRELRDKGEISVEEYERTRARVISKVKAAVRRDDERRHQNDQSRQPPTLRDEDAEAGDADV